MPEQVSRRGGRSGADGACVEPARGSSKLVCSSLLGRVGRVYLGGAVARPDNGPVQADKGAQIILDLK
jgi:hypothetical protein